MAWTAISIFFFFYKERAQIVSFGKNLYFSLQFNMSGIPKAGS